MKNILFFVTVLTFISSNVFAGASKKSVEELIKVMELKDQYTESRKMMSDIQIKYIDSNKNIAATFQTIQKLKDKYLSWDIVKADFIKVYSEAFTEEEIKGLINFYKTPLGQKLVEKQPEIAQKISKLIMERSRKYMPLFKQEMMKSIKNKHKKQN